MPPKKKEEEREEISVTFKYSDGTCFEGKCIVKKDTSNEVAPAVIPLKRGASAIGGGAQSSVNVTNHGAESASPMVYIQHGLGELRDTSGAQYRGQWREGKMCGNGAFRLPSGGTYTGEFANNTYHGWGRYTWSDGSYYEGAWVFNKMQGLGTYVDSKGQRWHGKFYDGAAVELVGEMIF